VRDVAGWIGAARAGRPEGIERIAATYRNYLLLIANQELDAQLQGKVGASDVVQETLLQVQRKFGQFEGANEEELLAWLSQILRRQLIDVSRRFRGAGKRQLGRERRLSPQDDSRGADLELPAAGASPRGEVIAREEQAALSAALERLPEDYRQVILWRSWERLSFTEIGKKMGRSAAAAGKLWARAIERLERELAAPDD
jgi:RNA polymerase sigma-70 factor (ECF subfamily)